MTTSRKSKIPGFHCLLEGHSGSGKTTSLRTLVEDCGLELFTFFTEPMQGMISDLPNTHYKVFRDQKSEDPWQEIYDMGVKVNSFGPDSLQKSSGANSNQKQFLDIVNSLNDFVCDCHGESFGAVDEWGTNRVLALDGLTKFSAYVRGLHVGTKTVLTQPEWGVGMYVIEHFFDKLLDQCWCHIVVIAHLEYEKDENTNSMVYFPITLGRKLGPKLPPKFNDAIVCERNGANFVWNAAPTGVIARAGFLPLEAKLPPTFKTIIDEWKARGGVIEE